MFLLLMLTYLEHTILTTQKEFNTRMAAVVSSDL